MSIAPGKIKTMEEIKTFAFFDLETTGIPELEFFKTKITEISVVACSVEHFLNEKHLRVLHKLTLCFNPFKRIDIKASDITGLTNDLLEHEHKFDENAMGVLEKFLSQLQQPVCLIAHNGEKFDFPLLKKQFEAFNANIPDSLKCCDSLRVLKEIDERFPDFKVVEVTKEDSAIHECDTGDFNGMQRVNETTPRKNRPEEVKELLNFKRKLFPNSANRQQYKSFALREIHKRFFNCFPDESHFAEADVLALMKCALKDKRDFVDSVNRHSIKFSDAKKF
jgi:three prime repair exonuclease 1